MVWQHRSTLILRHQSEGKFSFSFIKFDSVFIGQAILSSRICGICSKSPLQDGQKLQVVSLKIQSPGDCAEFQCHGMTTVYNNCSARKEAFHEGCVLSKAKRCLIYQGIALGNALELKGIAVVHSF